MALLNSRFQYVVTLGPDGIIAVAQQSRDVTWWTYLAIIGQRGSLLKAERLPSGTIVLVEKRGTESC